MNREDTQLRDSRDQALAAGNHYFVTDPVEGGYSYFDLRLVDSPHGPNFSVIQVYKDFPLAAIALHALCSIMNGLARET